MKNEATQPTEQELRSPCLVELQYVTEPLRSEIIQQRREQRQKMRQFAKRHVDWMPSGPEGYARPGTGTVNR